MCNQNKGCCNSDNRTDRPQECTPEQIRQCHGDEANHPCVEPTGCEHPERLTGKPGDCSPEQVRRCHGEPSGDA